MHHLGLRRGEVVALDLADLDLEAGTVAIVGKSRRQLFDKIRDYDVPT
jgi:integrase